MRSTSVSGAAAGPNVFSQGFTVQEVIVYPVKCCVVECAFLGEHYNILFASSVDTGKRA